jgi:hypothetical protein
MAELAQQAGLAELERQPRGRKNKMAETGTENYSHVRERLARLESKNVA